LTRQDAIDFMEIVSKLPIKVSITSFLLEEANEAIAALRSGALEGSIVLKIHYQNK